MAAKTSRGALGKVLVVGSNGFLGHHIVNQLAESWTTSAIFGVDLRCSRNINSAAEYHECDITDTPKLVALFEKLRPDVVIHTASPVASAAVKSDALFKKVNVGGTAAVVEACQKAGVKALVYTSSASIVSDNFNDLVNADERWPVIRGALQSEYYSETKAEAEEIVLKANRQEPYKLLTAAIRPAGIFGEGDVQLTPGIMKILRTNKSHIQVGDGYNIFDFTYVGNVSHGHLLAAHGLLASAASATVPLDYEHVDGEAFFITNDNPVYFWDFARAVWRAGGKEKGLEGTWTLPRGLGISLGFLSEVFCAALRIDPTFTRQRIVFASMTRYYNISKAKRVLRYQPLVGMQEGVDRSVKYILDQEAKEAKA